MSHIESTLRGNGDRHNVRSGLPAVPLNELFQESLRRRTEMERSNVIVRCEQLPQVSADRQVLTGLFNQMIDLILSTPSVGLRTFLYLDCEPQDKGGVQPQTPALFRIRFHTNIEAGETWREENASVLDDCRNVAAQCGGSLTVNSIQNTGCLFSLLLPGKL